MFGQLVGRERGRWTLLPTADVANNYNYMCYGGTLIPFVARAISRHSSTTIQLNYHLIFFLFLPRISIYSFNFCPNLGDVLRHCFNNSSVLNTFTFILSLYFT